ncbi:MAG: hypothetical protein P4L70_04180 [Parasulfuritortus sp.]|nr:hypothetical protein [Parasulfuritortus sp.]
MKRYLKLWLGLTGALIVVVAVFNFVIDPYGLFRFVDRVGFNSIKPTAEEHGRMAKAYQVLRVQPQGLIIGNSRMEWGFDPDNSAWPLQMRPVFNLALPGTSTSTSLHYLQHVLANAEGHTAIKPKIVIWGLDFFDFLVSSKVRRQSGITAHKESETERLLINLDGSANPSREFYKAKDYAESMFTLGAFLDSVQTLGSQSNPYSENLTKLGFNPMRDYLKIEADEGYWAVFRQKDTEYIKANLRRPVNIFYSNGRSSSALDDLRQVITLCRSHGIILHLVIYPYHAHLLETIRITGHWPAYETWLRTLSNIVATEPNELMAKPVLLWDFSGFNEISTESIPSQGNRRTKMQWYWEAGHFKSELGDRMLDRIFGKPGSISGFGILISPVNVDERIATLRIQESEYRSSHPQDIIELEHIASQFIDKKSH